MRVPKRCSSQSFQPLSQLHCPELGLQAAKKGDNYVLFACRPGPLKAALRDLCLQGTCSDNAAGALLMLNKYLGLIKVGTTVVSEWHSLSK